MGEGYYLWADTWCYVGIEVYVHRRVEYHTEIIIFLVHLNGAV